LRELTPIFWIAAKPYQEEFQGAPSIARLDWAGFSTINLDLGRRHEEAGGSEWGPNLVRVSGIKKFDLDWP
jgi:hypothetical protein